MCNLWGIDWDTGCSEMIAELERPEEAIELLPYHQAEWSAFSIEYVDPAGPESVLIMVEGYLTPHGLQLQQALNERT